MNIDNNLLRAYMMIFKKPPFLVWGMSYECPLYKKLIKDAINTGEPITRDKMNDYMIKHKVQVDTVIDYFDLEEDDDFEKY